MLVTGEIDPAMVTAQLAGLKPGFVIHRRNFGDIVAKIQIGHPQFLAHIDEGEDVEGAEATPAKPRIEIKIDGIEKIFAEVDNSGADQLPVKTILDLGGIGDSIGEEFAIVALSPILLTGIAGLEKEIAQPEVFLIKLQATQFDRHIAVVPPDPPLIAIWPKILDLQTDRHTGAAAPTMHRIQTVTVTAIAGGEKDLHLPFGQTAEHCLVKTGLLGQAIRAINGQFNEIAFYPCLEKSKLVQTSAVVIDSHCGIPSLVGII